MKKVKDPILLGIIAGLTGNVFKTIGDIISIKLGISQTSYPRIAGSFFMTNKQTESVLGKTVGWLTDAAMSAGLGVGFVYVLKFTGKDHALMKGVGYSHGAWTLLLGGANKMMTSNIYPQDAKTVLSQYTSHTLYGIGAALAASTLGDKDMFRKEDIDAKWEPTLEQPDEQRHLRIIKRKKKLGT